jgi:hypothetical protein
MYSEYLTFIDIETKYNPSIISSLMINKIISCIIPLNQRPHGQWRGDLKVITTYKLGASTASPGPADYHPKK